ncbi:MAG TPA: DUF6541 family protein [Pseudonocardiaceae bacterium]|nr:DUF6541 family protein [Pseudonocardiaceae bacterium]
MTAPAFSIVDAWLVAVYAMLLWLPGGALAAACGLRGWRLAAVAPLLTYALVGLIGPWASWLGLPFAPVTLALVVPAAGGAALLRRHRERHHSHETASDETDETPSAAGSDPSPWTAAGNAAVAACALLAAVVAAAVILTGMGRLSAIHQDWDAPFHANGIRWITETGDGGLFAMGELNWYDTAGAFYPNAYHLVASVVYQITGRSAPEVLNAHTLLIPAMLVLSLVALVRVMRGRAVLAGYTALVVACATPATFDLFWRGPLLPYATGVALIPVVIGLVADFLDRPALRTGGLFTLGAVGLLAIHASTLLAACLVALPYVLWRWWSRPRRLRREPALLAVAGVAGGLLTIPHLAGMLEISGLFPPLDRNPEQSPVQAVGALLTFEHLGVLPQWWLTAALAIGLVTLHRLGPLRWLAGSAAVATLPFLATAYDSPRLDQLLRPWFDDRWRFAALATVVLCPLVGHGLAEVQRVLAGAGRRMLRAAPAVPVCAAAAAAVLVAFAAATGGFYVERNVERVSGMHRTMRTVTDLEAQAYRELATMVAPGEWVMNDRGDGSAWIYSLTGVRTVAGHFDPIGVSADARLLGERFNRYDTDQRVRDAAARLHVRYVIVGRGHVVPHWRREAGLTRLDEVRALERVYENPDAVIYRLS